MPEENNFDGPVWLTEEYVEEKLRGYFKNDSLNVQRLKVEPAVPKGENYASVMTRVYADYTTKDSKVKNTMTFLVKTTFADKDPGAFLLSQYGVYTREMDMYEDILPHLSDLVKKELGDSRKMFAGTVHVDRELDSIFFEDLSLEQCKVACRIKKLDLEHTCLLLEKLASFHAAGAALAKRNPGIFEKNYDRCFFNKHTRGYEPIMRNFLQALSLSLEYNEDLREKYQAKIDRLVDNVMDYGERSVTPDPGDFVTLCHGDLWTTNMMFQYDDSGHPSNAIFIDFQFSVWNSPAIDLYYFFFTSVQENLCLQKQSELVQFYYYKLVEALKKLKYSGRIPSLFEFQQQIRSKAFYAVFSSLLFAPCMLYIGEEEASIEQGITNSESGLRFRNSVFVAEHIREKMQFTLPFLDHLGLLDDM
ncbi:hypothetical protein KR009_006154 [Drosophila setifemur]|nr:hypothetical protein KR009_006154 [Drosophila setifemur]